MGVLAVRAIRFGILTARTLLDECPYDKNWVSCNEIRV